MKAEPTPIRYVYRETGKLVDERLFGGGALRFLYGTRTGRLLTYGLLANKTVSNLYGWLKRRGASRAEIANFVSTLGIDVTEAEKPVEQYVSLNDFFTRRLKPEARPIDPDPLHLISPCDARVLVLPAVDGPIRVKGSSATLEQILADAELAKRYRGGVAYVIRLAPADYHRFHFPETGTASPGRKIGRVLHSVHPLALEAGAPSFVNAREVSTLATERWGTLALIEVGALLVGSIVQTYTPGPVKRGQEKGYFCFGGSTTLLLVEPGKVLPDEDLVKSSAQGTETWLKMGTRIGRAP